MAYAKIRPRRGTLYEWSTYNPILDSGELVLEFPDSGIGSGFCKFKVGDGVTPYTELPYAFDGNAANSIDGGSPTAYSVIQIRSADTATWSDVNPVLNENEIIYDKTANSFKVGDGVNRFDDLPYIRSNNMTDDWDFGDEDADESTVYGSENIVRDNDYPPNALPENWRDIIESNTDNSQSVVNSEAEEDTAGIESLIDDRLDLDGGSPAGKNESDDLEVDEDSNDSEDDSEDYGEE